VQNGRFGLDLRALSAIFEGRRTGQRHKMQGLYLRPASWPRGLLRFPELLFQLLHKLSQALVRDGVGGHGGHTLGLLKTPLQFFSVALFVHGDTPSFVGRGSDAMVHIS
jgi:hypothetical protein